MCGGAGAVGQGVVANPEQVGRVSGMAVTVRIPTTMRPISGGASTVQVEAGSLKDVLDSLNAAHNGFAERLFDGAGELHKFVNIFVSDDDVRYLQGLDTPVKDGDTVSIIPAVAGG